MLIKEALIYHDVKSIMKHYKVSRAQAYVWLRQGYAVIRTYPKAMPSIPADKIKLIALRSARYVAARQRDYDLVRECEQAALIAIWKDADKIGSDEARAYKAGRMAALAALRDWRVHKGLSLEDWLPEYELNDLDDLGDGTGDGLDGERVGMDYTNFNPDSEEE